ncbi:MAG: nitrate/nitrite transporter NrtS [Pseudomonadota bacterium]
MPDSTETLLDIARRKSVVKRSAKVAVIVGTLLLIINQGDRIVAGMAPDWIKMILTYCVPYCVSTYASVCAVRERMDQDKSG